MSVGHISRAVEEAGIPTVIIASGVFKTKLVSMSVPRLLLTERIMGRPLGHPGDVQFQFKVLKKGLSMLESATSNGTYLEMTN